MKKEYIWFSLSIIGTIFGTPLVWFILNHWCLLLGFSNEGANAFSSITGIIMFMAGLVLSAYILTEFIIEN